MTVSQQHVGLSLDQSAFEGVLSVCLDFEVDRWSILTMLQVSTYYTMPLLLLRWGECVIAHYFDARNHPIPDPATRHETVYVTCHRILRR